MIVPLSSIIVIITKSGGWNAYLSRYMLICLMLLKLWKHRIHCIALTFLCTNCNIILIWVKPYNSVIIRFERKSRFWFLTWRIYVKWTYLICYSLTSLLILKILIENNFFVICFTIIQYRILFNFSSSWIKLKL